MTKTIRQTLTIAVATTEIMKLAKFEKESDVFSYAFHMLAKDISNNTNIDWDSFLYKRLDGNDINYTQTRYVYLEDHDYEIVLNSFKQAIPNIKRVRLAFLIQAVLIYVLEKLKTNNQANTSTHNQSHINIDNIDIFSRFVELLKDESKGSDTYRYNVIENLKLYTIHKMLNEEIVCKTNDVLYDEDSSPQAWDFYRKIYIDDKALADYRFDNLHFYTSCKGPDNSHLYKNEPKKNYFNRLFALHINTSFKKHNGKEYCEATPRLSGDCIFNFNADKCDSFLKFAIGNEKALKQLERCRRKHHSRLNFSLIQSLGDLQGIKGKLQHTEEPEPFDRADLFIATLDNHYKKSTDICASSKSSKANKEELRIFLNKFQDIYEYCSILYQITDHTFVDRLINQSSIPITDCDALVEYMTLAEEFWQRREKHLITTVNFHL